VVVVVVVLITSETMKDGELGDSDGGRRRMDMGRVGERDVLMAKRCATGFGSSDGC